MRRDREIVVSYQDVLSAMDAVGRLHNRTIFMEMSQSPHPNGHRTLWVRAVSRLREGDNHWANMIATGAAWPCNDYSTMTGLMLSLVYQLDFKLTQMEEDAKAASAAQDRLL